MLVNSIQIWFISYWISGPKRRRHGAWRASSCRGRYRRGAGRRLALFQTELNPRPSNCYAQLQAKVAEARGVTGGELQGALLVAVLEMRF